MKNFFQYTSTELGNLLYFEYFDFFFMIAQCGAMSLLNSYLWRIYQTFFVNGLVGYHLMMSKQRFCTNLNSFFAEGEPKLCLCFVLVATFSFWSSRRKKKTNSWQKSSLQRYWPKIPIWVTWYIWAFDHFFLHCIALYCTNGGMRLSPFS